MIWMSKSAKYNVHDTCYYMEKQVVVLKIFHNFNLVKIKMKDTVDELVVDLHALSLKPIKDKYISIKWLGGE